MEIGTHRQIQLRLLHGIAYKKGMTIGIVSCTREPIVVMHWLRAERMRVQRRFAAALIGDIMNRLC